VQIRHLRSTLAPLNLRLIHSGRLLTDGILLLPWLRSLEERVRRQAAGVGGDVESVLKEVGLADDNDDEDVGGDGSGRGRGEGRDRDGNGSGGGERKGKGEERVWLHGNVGSRMDVKNDDEGAEEVSYNPVASGFDCAALSCVLLVDETPRPGLADT
jgi:hypothetical protein